MRDVPTRSFAGLLGTGITAPQLPPAISGSSPVSTVTDPERAKSWYIDGLSLMPSDLNDTRASKIDASICDIYAIEQVVETALELMRCCLSLAEISSRAQ